MLSPSFVTISSASITDRRLYLRRTMTEEQPVGFQVKRMKEGEGWAHHEKSSQLSPSSW